MFLYFLRYPSTTEDERGWFGTEVRRLVLTYEDGQRGSKIFKVAALK